VTPPEQFGSVEAVLLPTIEFLMLTVPTLLTLMPPPNLAEFEAIVTKLRLAVPLDTMMPPPLKLAALFPEIVPLVMVTVPISL
jgi:hypothetical protein